MRNITGNQRGMALITALMLLMVISLMAVGVSTDTSMDVRIAGFIKFKALSFADSEAGLMAATDILEDNIFDAGWTNPAPPAPFAYPNLSNDYVGSITVEQDGKFYMDKNLAENRILSMTGDLNADIVTQRVVSKLTHGGAIQVAAGYAGTGKGVGSGGGQVVYNLVGNSTSAGQARTDLAVYYRHVTK